MSTKTKALLVVNPISGGRDKSEIIDFLEKRFQREQQKLSIYYTSGKDDRSRLEGLILQLQPERVLVIGGDGTIKLLAGILKETNIPIGLFPAGSANGLAENLDLPANLEELAEVALGNNLRELDCIDVNEEVCLHISDVGLNAELVKNYEEGMIRGKLGYLLQSIPALIKSDFPFRFSINIDGEVHYREGFLLAIANARKYGTGATINPIGEMNDGRFEILVFKKFNIPQILKTFREEVELSEDFMEIFPAREAIIESEKELPFQVDGEYLGQVKKVVARISELKVRIAVGG